jgi:pimeloyl-ACP methyl ester carboxylesterase
MPEFEFEGRPVAFREAGAGVPVIMAHCSLAHSGMFKPIMAGLAATHHVISIDLPAHGGTAPPPEGRSLQIYAADMIAALIDELGQPAHLVGLSLGGATLGRLAIRSPARARSLTMIEPVWFFLLDKIGGPGKAEDDRVMALIAEASAKGDNHEAVRHFIEAWGAPGGFEALGDKGQAYAAGVFPHLERDLIYVHGRPPGQITEVEIAALAPPVMLMAGSETPAAARHVIDEIARLVPKARIRIIKGGGHMSPVTHWSDVLAELQAFIAAVEAG